MKRIVSIFFAVLAAVSCANKAEQPVGEYVTLTLTATVNPVKGELEKDQFFSWSPEDRILVELSDGSTAVFTTLEGGSTAEFTGRVPAGVSAGSRAYYPADAVSLKGGVSFDIAQNYDGTRSAVEIPMAGSRWEGEPFIFRPCAGAVKITVENVPDDFGNSGTVVFQASRATNGRYSCDPESGKLLWDPSVYASDGTISDGSRISVSVTVTQGRSIYAYVPLPENSDWGGILVSLVSESGKTILQKSIPSSVTVPVTAGRVTRLPNITFPAEIFFALDPADGDFSRWDEVENLINGSVYVPWTWRGSWMAEDVYTTEEFNIACKQVKFDSDEKYVYGYVYLDKTILTNATNDCLKNFYVMIDNDDVAEGQSFGGTNTGMPRYRGYNLMLYGASCNAGVPVVWDPVLSDCTAAAGASSTNVNGTAIDGVSAAGYGGGSLDGEVIRWEFVIDKAKTGLLGRSESNICIAFGTNTNSGYLVMPSIYGFTVQL